MQVEIFGKDKIKLLQTVNIVKKNAHIVRANAINCSSNVLQKGGPPVKGNCYY